MSNYIFMNLPKLTGNIKIYAPFISDAQFSNSGLEHIEIITDYSVVTGFQNNNNLKTVRLPKKGAIVNPQTDSDGNYIINKNGEIVYDYKPFTKYGGTREGIIFYVYPNTPNEEWCKNNNCHYVYYDDLILAASGDETKKFKLQIDSVGRLTATALFNVGEDN